MLTEAAKVIKVQMLCGTCGSTEVTHDAWAAWDVDSQSWALGEVFDYAFCHVCEDETRIVEAQLTH